MSFCYLCLCFTHLLFFCQLPYITYCERKPEPMFAWLFQFPALASLPVFIMIYWGNCVEIELSCFRHCWLFIVLFLDQGMDPGCFVLVDVLCYLHVYKAAFQTQLCQATPYRPGLLGSTIGWQKQLAIRDHEP